MCPSKARLDMPMLRHSKAAETALRNSVEPGHSFLHLSCNFAVPGEVVPQRRSADQRCETCISPSHPLKELLLLKQFQSRSDASKLERGETCADRTAPCASSLALSSVLGALARFASARSEMASFLFLATRLLSDEVSCRLVKPCQAVWTHCRLVFSFKTPAP